MTKLADLKAAEAARVRKASQNLLRAWAGCSKNSRATVPGQLLPRADLSGPTTKQASSDVSREPAVGILDGGLHSVEVLMLARFFMFTQLYFRPVRRIYDIHLRDFLVQTLPGGKYPSIVNEHLEITDNEVTAWILKASRDAGSLGHDPARRIAKRERFKLFYSRHPDDLKINLQPGKAVYEAAKQSLAKRTFAGTTSRQRGVRRGKAQGGRYPE
jgi:hypothetical protein